MKLTQEQALSLTISEIWNGYYLPEKHARKAIQTVRGYVSSYQLHILPKWGHLKLTEIDRDEVQKWMDSFADNPGGGQKAYKTLRQIINWSINKWGLYILNPTQGIELPRKPLYKPATLTQRRLKRFIRGMVGFIHEPTVILQASLGIRPSENYALSWSDINWRTGLIAIRKSLQVVDGVWYEQATKTPKSERDVYLPPWALDRLHQLWIAIGRPKGRIIGNTSPRTVTYRIKRWIHFHKLPSISMENLRHTWGTIAAQSGVAIEVVAAMMGHSNIQTCYRYYFALQTSAIRRAQRKVSRLIMGKTCQDMYSGIPLAAPEYAQTLLAA